jgi:3',5'-cyclic AMP phosphodiesterase CpdA
VSPRILHVSDLHFGARRALREPAADGALAALVERLEPDLLIASGDLTHRGRREQHEAAAGFLRGFGVPVLAVPGNHDIPYSAPHRLTRTWVEFERQWPSTEPLFAGSGLHVVGLNSVRPWRNQSGGIGRERLEAALRRLQAAQPGALRVVVLHHQLVGAPWRTRKKPVARRTHVLARLVDGGADLIVGGHVHQGSVCERHEFEVLAGAARGAVVTTAPGFGRPRPHRRGEAKGVLVYSADSRQLRVETYIWHDDRLELTARRLFPRGEEPLEELPG